MTLAIYKSTEKIPRHEMFGLTSQIRRSAASVGANIAEGYALGSTANYLRHLSIAVGSLAETEYHLELAHDLSYLIDEDYSRLCTLLNEIGYLLSRLKHRLSASHIRHLRNLRYLRHIRNSYVN